MSKEKKDKVEKEILLTKHCHVLLIRLPFLANGTIKRRCLRKLEKKLECYQPPILKRAKRRINAPSTQSASKIKVPIKRGGKVVHKTDSKAHVSRETKHSKQYNKRKHFVSHNHTQSHASKAENNSLVELSRQKDSVAAKDDRSKNTEDGPCSITFLNERTKSARHRDSKKFRVCLSLAYYVYMFKEYLLNLCMLGRNGKMYILSELARRSTSAKFFVKNTNREIVLNKGLIEWIVGRFFEKEVLLENQDEIIKNAIRKAEAIVIKKSKHENEMLRQQMAQADENALFDEHEVLKYTSTALVDGEAAAIRSRDENALRSENLCIEQKVLAPDNKLTISGFKEAAKANEGNYFPFDDFLYGEPWKESITEINNTPKNVASVTEAKTCCFAALANNICACRSSGIRFIHSIAEKKKNLSFMTASKPDSKIRMEDNCRLEKCDGKSCLKCKIQLITTKGTHYSFRPLDKPFDPKISEAVRILKSNHISYLRRRKGGFGASPK
ncbi:hypothetical protein HNY73_013082 [Argiope bruennichi]|uniref:Uncharacterized protein n=1 Tax=Argiope bruennichi TaxID=94029 RepID=A0A8T0EZ25_ARGBR|nr:hypothetical protein HNY73_013082 [Argiope bruennichi]